MKYNGALAFIVALAFGIGIVFCAANAIAQQPVDGGTPDAGTVTDTGAPADGEVTIDQLTEAGKKAVEDWETLGWVAGMAGVIGFLLLLMRFKPLDKLLEDKGVKWIKPYIAIGLGALLGFFSTFASGKSIGFSIVMGLVAGVTSPGLHLLLTKGNSK
jgi:hypothetical protein